MARLANEDLYDRPMREFPLIDRILLKVALGILWVVSKLMWRWRVEGAERLRAAGTGSVIICNHTSMAEVVAIMAHLLMTGAPTRAIGKSEFFEHPLIAWAFARAGSIPVKRGSADMGALRAAQHALGRGENVLIFPEGTRVRTDDQPVEVHGGYALIAQMGKAPVVPMAVCGFRDITPAGSRVPRPLTCWIRVGGPVSLADAPVELSRRERLAWLEGEGMRRVYEIRDALRAEHPGRR
ncbi:MAG: lysophospholipid acyltransferase family protein [Collinsella sp.]|nr:lysophospholipid acyltransferase family protein [Collinsella sp.]